MNDIALGMALEEMLASDGWKHVTGFLSQKEERTMKDLATKQFKDMGDVRALQERLKVYAELTGDIDDRIRRGKEKQKAREQA